MKPRLMNLLYQLGIIDEPKVVEVVEDAEITEIDYGDKFRGRKLINGGWVLERRGSERAIDLCSPTCTWSPSSTYYGECIAKDLKSFKPLAENALSIWGV